MKVSELIQDLQQFNPDEEITVCSFLCKEDYELFYNDEEPISLSTWEAIVKKLDTHEGYWSYYQANLGEVIAQITK
jgi:hypothetical protein